MVTGNERAVSVIRNVAVVATDDVTENETFPFFVSIVTGNDAPFIFVPESPLTSSILRLSLTGEAVLLHPMSSTEMVAAFPTCTVLGETYTCEFSAVGALAQEDVEAATTGMTAATVG